MIDRYFGIMAQVHPGPPAADEPYTELAGGGSGGDGMNITTSAFHETGRRTVGRVLGAHGHGHEHALLSEAARRRRAGAASASSAHEVEGNIMPSLKTSFVNDVATGQGEAGALFL